MSKTKNVLLFTVGEGKKAKELDRKSYVSEVLANLTKPQKELGLEAKHINALIDLAIEGNEPEEETPDGVKELFETIKEQYEAAKEAFDEREEEANKEAKEAEKAKLEKDKETKSLVEYVNEAPTGSDAMETFREKFDLGDNLNQCVPKEGVEVTLKDWVGVLSLGIGLENASQWIIGDAAVALEEAGHEDVVVQIAAQFKKSYPTISGYARTSRAFPALKRDSSISFTAYREIGNAKFDGTEAKVAKLRDKLVADVKKNQWSAIETRDAVRTLQGKEKPTGSTGASLKYLLLNTENVPNSSLLSELPESIEEHQVLIDMAKKSYLVTTEKDGETSQEWVAFGESK